MACLPAVGKSGTRPEPLRRPPVRCSHPIREVPAISRKDQTTDGTITRERDLHEAPPLWADSARRSVRHSLKPKARSYDVVIVGAGISGALMAHALADGRRSVLVLDRRKPVTGSTLASTAMIQHEIDVPLFDLTRMIGKAKAERAWRRSARAVEQLTEIVADIGIDCAFERKKTLFLAGDTYGSRALRTEIDARVDAGLVATHVDAATLRDRFAIDRTGAILSDISASADPARLAAGLLRAAAARGAEIVSGPEISDFHATGDEVVLATSGGDLLVAGDAVFCTGYEFLKTLSSKQHAIVSTWALASRPGLDLPDWLDDHIVWEGSDPYLYLRRNPDGRLIAGGEDEESETAYLDAAKRKAKMARIVEKAEALIGCRIGKPDYAWSAPFGTTTTGLPLIGTVPGETHVHAVMGFGGNGITFSQIAAEVVSAAINGHKDADADLFRFKDG